MQPFSLKLLKYGNSKVRSGFLFPLAFCLLSVSFYIPPHFSVPVVAQTTDVSEAEGDRLMQQGLQQYQTGQLPAALNSWQQALQIYRVLKNRRREGRILGSLVVAYSSLGNYAKAIEYAQQHLAIAREIKDRYEEGVALGNLGLAYLSLGNDAKAIEYSQLSLAIAREIKDREGESRALGNLVFPINRRGEVNTLGNLGIAYINLGNYAKAIEYGQQQLAIAREIKDRDGEGTALGNLGVAYRSLGNYAKAIEYIQQSLAIAREIKDRDGEGIALGNLGSAYRSLGNYAQAIEYSQQSLAIAREIKDRLGEGAELTNLGIAYRSLGNYAKAIEYAEQSLAIAREIKDREAEGKALVNLGIAYDSLGDYAKAIEYAQQHLAIAREIKDRRGEGNALGNLGIAYQFLGNYAKAIEYSQLSLAIAREIKNRQGESRALGILGLAYDSLGNYAKAIEYSQLSLAIAREIKNRQGEALALGILGGAYDSLGNYGKAIEYAQQRLAIAREIKDRQGEGSALNNLGGAYHSLGNYAKAIEYSQQSLAIAREIKNREGEGNALNNLGIAYQFLGNYAKAIEYAQQRLAIAREIKDRQGEGHALGNLGLAYSSLGNYAKAIEYTQQYLAIAREIKDRQGEGGALNNLGGAYLALGNYAKAIEYAQQRLAIAREIKDRQGEGGALGNLGIAYNSLGDYAKAIEYSQQRLAIAREIKDRQNEGGALNNLGVAFLKAGNPTEAEKMLVNGIQVWESMRQMLGSNDANKVSIFERQAATYRTLQQVRVAQNNPIGALEIAERGRARAFVDLLTERLSSGSSNPVIATSPNQDQIRQIAKAQNATLVQYSIVHDTFQIQGKQVGRESALYIWVIQPTGEITFREVDLKPLWQKQNGSLANLIINYQQFLGVRSRSSLGSTQPQPDLPTLHKLLIDPIASLLPKDPNAHVIFIPQDSLFQVPFPALQDANGTYLIEKHTILTAPSIQVLDLTRQQRQKLAQQPTNSGRALVLGNPTMPTVSLSPGEPKRQLEPLPGAEAEARSIAPLLNTQAITGAQGTKAAIVQKMPQASIIHLATHGLLDDVRGLASAIALAPSGNDNGLLTAEEIFDMKLQASLVVLSACNTGEGKITGDGVIGLSRSLISAGVPSVIVSLWRVPDAPTAELMKEFYQNLQKNPNKAQALRQAMLTTMKTHSNPRDWAAFTLIGEAE
jgi:tetratricopeptide (TPR) repeat protein/CHAT domain-containing protein